MTLDRQLTERVDAVFADRVARSVAPSSVWGVFDGTGLLATGGHGDRGDGSPPDDRTVYRIASCTKSVTATTLLVLAADRRLDLDAPVTDFVPAFAEVALPTADSPVPTVRMLLTMSGGFPTDDPWADRQESISDADLDAVLRGGLLFDSVPGTRFAYSNLGYALLGRVVAVVTGRPFPDVATTTVLRPLGLGDTAFSADGLDGFVVTGTRPYDGTWEQLPTTGPGAFSSIGGLFSTVTDLARWGAHLASAFSDAPEPGPLSPADRRLMQQAMRVVPPTVVPGSTRATAYGFGLFVEQDDRFGPIVSHSGGYPGFSAHMRWSTRDGLGVVAFENATQAKVSVAATDALDLVLAARESAREPTHESAGRTPVAPVTRRAQGRVTRLLSEWDDALADAVFTPNVALDEPYERRRRRIAQAVDDVGADLGAVPVDECSLTPTHLRWWLPGTSGRLRVEIRLAPLAAGLVQTLIVAPERSET